MGGGGSRSDRTKAGRPLSAEERALWRHVTETVNRTAPLDVDPDESAPPPPARPHATPRRRAHLPPPDVPATKAPPALTHGGSVGMDGKTARRLKRGKLMIDARLDLHGHTQRAAHDALTGFIARGIDRGHRTVLVITGKGDPVAGRPGVLKDMVPRWLNEMPIRQWVSGFSYAAVKDGGEGALYIRLKRTRSGGSP